LARSVQTLIKPEPRISATNFVIASLRATFLLDHEGLIDRFAWKLSIERDKSEVRDDVLETWLAQDHP